MKKLIILLGFLFFAQPVLAYDYAQICAVPPYAVSNKVAQAMSNVTGMNFLVTQVAESVMQRELKKKLNSNFKVQIKPYGAKNFINGKFKSLTLSSPRIVYGGASISDFRATTLCPYNQVVLQKNDVAFTENFVLKYSTVVTNEDFQTTVLSKEYLNTISKFNVNIGTKTLFKVFDPTATLVNDRVKLTFKIMTPLFFTSEVNTAILDAGLAVQNERIVFTDIKIGDSNDVNLSKLLPIINRLSPLTYNVKVSKSSSGVLKVQNVKVANSKIFIDGVFIIPKNYAI